MSLTTKLNQVRLEVLSAKIADAKERLAARKAEKASGKQAASSSDRESTTTESLAGPSVENAGCPGESAGADGGAGPDAGPAVDAMGGPGPSEGLAANGTEAASATANDGGACDEPAVESSETENVKNIVHEGEDPLSSKETEATAEDSGGSSAEQVVPNSPSSPQDLFDDDEPEACSRLWFEASTILQRGNAELILAANGV